MPTVLITGTSSGIGRVTTKVLATRGWHVFATMRDMTKKGMLEAALDRAKLGGKVEILQLDVSDERSIYAAVAEVTTRTRNKIDAVVHNAGSRSRARSRICRNQKYVVSWRRIFSVCWR